MLLLGVSVIFLREQPIFPCVRVLPLVRLLLSGTGVSVRCECYFQVCVLLLGAGVSVRFEF